MKSFWLIMVVGFLVTGCVSREERAARQNQADDEQCVSYGFRQGTEDYAKCRLLVAERRQQQQQNELAIGAMLLQQSQPSNTIIAPSTHCTSYQQGNYLNTDCQ